MTGAGGDSMTCVLRPVNEGTVEEDREDEELQPARRRMSLRPLGCDGEIFGAMVP